jgi:hypothetical protein
MGPPTTTTLKKPSISVQGTATTSQEAPAPKRDAYEVLMNREGQRSQTLDKGKGKAKAKATKQTPAPSKSLKPGEKDHAGPSAKEKTMKEKMRRKAPTQSKLPIFAPLSDDDDAEEEYPGPNKFSRIESKDKMEVTRPEILFPEPNQFSPTKPEEDAQPKKAPPESLEPTPTVDGPVIESAEEDPSVSPTPAFVSLDIHMVDTEIPRQIQDDEPKSAAPEPSQEPPPAVVDEAIMEMGANAPEPEGLVGDNVAGVIEEPPAAERNPRPSRASKLPLGKKRQPISVEPAARVTRSASNSKKIGELSGSTAGLSGIKSMTMGRLPAKRTASGTVKETAPPEETPLAESEAAAESTLPPGSPMKMSSPIRASDMGTPTKKDEAKTLQIGPGRLSLARTPTKSKFSSEKPASSPSPSKIARSSSYMSMRPPGKLRQF